MIKRLFKLLPFVILIFALVTSNLGLFSDNAGRKILLYSSFAYILVYSIITNKKSIGVLTKLTMIVIVIAAYEMIFKSITFTDDWVIFLFMDLGMIWIGYFMRQNKDYNSFRFLLRVYIIVCAFACAYSITTFDITNAYEFGLKNSQTPLYLLATIILLLDKDEFPRALHWPLLALTILTILRMNSRSNVIALLICMVYILYRNRKIVKAYIIDGKHKFVGFAVMCCGLYYSSRILSTISSALRLYTLSEVGLERYSADRIPMILAGLRYFDESPFFGIYNTNPMLSEFYVECFPIEVLVQLGIIGALLYITWFSALGRCLNQHSVVAGNLGIVCFTAMLVVSLFESNAPMSPGTTYGFAWIVIGYHLSSSQIN